MTDVRVQDPADYGAFNETAVRVAGEMEFEPAINQDERIGVWVSQTIRFSVEAG